MECLKGKTMVQFSKSTEGLRKKTENVVQIRGIGNQPRSLQIMLENPAWLIYCWIGRGWLGYHYIRMSIIILFLLFQVIMKYKCYLSSPSTYFKIVFIVVNIHHFLFSRILNAKFNVI